MNIKKNKFISISMNELLILLPAIFIYFNMNNKIIKKNINSIVVIYGLFILYYFHNRDIVEGVDNKNNNVDLNFLKQVINLKSLNDNGKIGPYHEAKKKYIDEEHAENYKNKTIKKLDKIKSEKDTAEIDELTGKIIDDLKKWFDNNGIEPTETDSLFHLIRYLDQRIHISDGDWHKSNSHTKIKKIEKIFNHINNNNKIIVEGFDETTAQAMADHQEAIQGAVVCTSGIILTCLIGGIKTRGKSCDLIRLFCDEGSFGHTILGIIAPDDGEGLCPDVCMEDLWHWMRAENADERPSFDDDGNYDSPWFQECSHNVPHCDCIEPPGWPMTDIPAGNTAFRNISYNEEQYDAYGNPTGETISRELDLTTPDKVRIFFKTLSNIEERYGRTHTNEHRLNMALAEENIEMDDR
jgi:hypothetical protein